MSKVYQEEEGRKVVSDGMVGGWGRPRFYRFERRKKGAHIIAAEVVGKLVGGGGGNKTEWRSVRVRTWWS